MPQIFGVEVPDELINMSIESFCRAVTPIISFSQGSRFMEDMLAANAPSLSAMRDSARQWVNRPELFRGIRYSDGISTHRDYTEGPISGQPTEFFAGDSLTYTPIHNNKPDVHLTKWDHRDMLNLLMESVPPKHLSVAPRRNGQEVSVNMNSTFGKGILCHINQYGELFLHQAFRVKKRIRGQFTLGNVYQSLKEAFTIDLYLKKEDPYHINLLDTPAELIKFKPSVVQGETYYMSGQGPIGNGFTDGRDIDIDMTLAAGRVIATGMEDLYSIISKKITVNQPERKVNFGVVQGRLGR